MIPLPPTTRIYLACGATDMRKGLDGLAELHRLQAADLGDPEVTAILVDGHGRVSTR